MKKIFIILIIISVCTTCYNTAHSQPYRYPVMPGDSLWKNEKSYVDKVKLCNIPDSFLTSMSTDDLIISIFQFPYIQNLLLFDNFILDSRHLFCVDRSVTLTQCILCGKQSVH